MEEKTEVQELNNLIDKCNLLKKEIAKVIIGQEDIINNVLISMFSSGHCLLVGVPGLAKTLLVNTIAKALGLTYNRIQFTPDLMPSDIVGNEILDSNREFKFIKGPLFSNIILADEINRTSPKTQSALLESMQEHSVTVSGKTYKLNEPFFVLATQNPIEQEGTYPLPEAQLDRLLMKVKAGYPQYDEELKILTVTAEEKNHPIEINPVINLQDLASLRDRALEVPVDPKIDRYI